MDNIFYSIRNGKNPKYSYYLKSYFLRLLPLKAICRKRLNKILAQTDTRSDKNYIHDRVNYYNRLAEPVKLPEGSPHLNELKLQKKGKAYYFDSFEYLRYFPENLQWNYCFGDINFMPDTPSIVKSRPIHNQSANAILLNLNKVRHFIFVKDKIPFEKKMDKVIFRGKVNEGKTKRIAFFNKYFGNPLYDLGDTSRNGNPAWRTGKKTIAEHLRYKFILALEGNDVASNLKWVMSSNSVAVMPRPEFETWFMEGRLIPNYHYIEIKPDFSDLEERIAYYTAHPDEAIEISRHANEYVSQFFDKKREKLISLLVLQKYFRKTGQLEQ